MPNIAAVLRDEISRLSRKEIRKLTETTRKASVEHRGHIAELKRQVGQLQRKVALLEKRVLKEIPSQVKPEDAGTVRFRASGLVSSRKRLGLSAADLAALLGVTGQTVYKWEHGTSRPRAQQVAAIAAVRSMGKKEARARLEALGQASSGKKSK